jgi:hypothetical protein
MIFSYDKLVRYAARALSIEECGGESQRQPHFPKLVTDAGTKANIAKAMTP